MEAIFDALAQIKMAVLTAPCLLVFLVVAFRAFRQFKDLTDPDLNFSSEAKLDNLNNKLFSGLTTLLSVTFTTVLFSLMANLMIYQDLRGEDVPSILLEGFGIFIAISALFTVSVIAKGIVLSKNLQELAEAKDEKEYGAATAKGLMFMAMAELPGLAGLVLFMLRQMVGI